MAGEGFVWLYMYEDGMNVPEEYELIDFQAGLYAVATDIDQKINACLQNGTNLAVKETIKETTYMKNYTQVYVKNSMEAAKYIVRHLAQK